MLSHRYFNENMSAFAPCANAAFACAQSYSANAVVMILDAILASIFVIALAVVLDLIALLVILAILGLAILVIIRKPYMPWCSEPKSLSV